MSDPEQKFDDPASEGDYDAQVAAIQKEIAALEAKPFLNEEEKERLEALERDVARDTGEVDERAEEV